MVALDGVVRKRLDRESWTTTHSLLAVIADHLGVLASGQQYTTPVKRLRRPGEPDPDAPKQVSWGQFARMLTGKTAA